MHSFNGLTPVRSFASAIAAAKPDFIIPGDDLAARHLHQLYDREQRNERNANGICALIERSLGAPESFPVVDARPKFMEVAEEIGVRGPKTEVIKSTDDLRRWIDRSGFPTVLKADGTSGGDGVRIVHTAEEAKATFQTLQAPPLLARAIKRAIVDRDTTLLIPSLLRRRRVVNAQTFIAGREATSAVVCFQGKILASLHFEVINKFHSAGHATVVRIIENSDMSAAAEKIARTLNLSGLHGFDFMLEAHSGNAYLIEMNPRATQVGHLNLGLGRDLPAALYAALSGQPIQAAEPVTENDTIALFPQEWLRDPGSSFLKSAYHDVPWKEPELIKDFVRKSQARTSRTSKLAWIPAVPSLHRADGFVARSLNCKTD